MARIATLEFPLSQLGSQFLGAGSLSLRSRQIVLTGNLLHQFWVPKPGLFGIRNRRSGNHAVVLKFFQLLCFERVHDQDNYPAKTHLLASLLPHVRNNKAQDIFPDASIAPPRGCPSTPGFDSEELESQLRVSEHERISVVDFCNRNREAVEFPDYPESTLALYRDFESELFADDTSLWWTDPTTAREQVTQRWLRWRNGIGRHRGNEQQKDVLNILSFESKAAFHQCYSALWCELIPILIVDQENRLMCQRFHSLWHLDQRMNISGRDRDVHLLHGLVLGLHPAFGMLLTTETGKRLVGEMVVAPEDTSAQERFLHAGLVSLYSYATTRRFRC